MHYEILVEEESARVLLDVLMPRLAPEATFRVHPFQGKRDLLRKLPERLRGLGRGLGRALPSDSAIVVLVDRDRDDCVELKAFLQDCSAQAGLGTASGSRAGQLRVLNRIAIEELEAWYFGDWEAVRQAYPGVSEQIPRKKRYRDPDAIAGGTSERFESIMQRAGYHTTGLRKTEAARRIGALMDPDRNCSRSFQVFRMGIRAMEAAQARRAR